jgi:flotillin
MEELISILAVIGVVGAGAGTALVALARNLLFICEPNEVLIFSGLRGGGSGYRTVKGGRAWRVPLLETVDRLDLTNMIIDVAVTNAYSLGGIPLTVQGVANVKIAGHDPVLGNAVERMLGKERDDVARIAKEVLEGNLRGVLSRLTPEEVNEDKLAFAEKLLDEAEPDLARLGLVLDTMKIQNVSDERGYLDSIGRQKSAEIIKKSRVAEANAKARAIIQDSENRRRARLKELASDTEIAQAQAERRVADAKTRGKAMVAEQIGQVEAMIAKAEGALEAEEARVERVRRQLEADVIEPARADMEAGIASAKGRAAKIFEEGRATVLVLREMVAVWQAAGPNARDIFLMQKFQAVLDALVQTINTVKVDKLTMLPGNSDSTATRAVQLVEELKGALGVDLPQMLADVTSGQAQAQLPDRKL